MISNIIKERLEKDGVRYWANDNIANYIQDHEIELLIDELEEKFIGVLQSLIVDLDTDPNSAETPRRLAKMYINELFKGRFSPLPNLKSFPNNVVDGYSGMVFVNAPILSLCSHHHQIVEGVAMIGVLGAKQLLGLSKYIRIAQHCARRGTLQEELTTQIANEIQNATDTESIAVFIQATHGCVKYRGVTACTGGLTSTTVLRGAFLTDGSTKKEFFDNIKLQMSKI